ncbi:RNA polymerase sigma factor [Streptomyces sp. A2-16]|uniref:RNA polymerase sigma factor n=1 Tax=Streptomyces sp. A2-16 TaxID=2781734 RepID=UPI002012534B|nr:RNA polymerase sigma factor [Streptomyces sp. A2-16]
MTTDMRTRIRAGDPDAFAELYGQCARSVYNHAFRLTADWSVAEDVMSATFMEAWRRRDSIEAEGGSLRPWLLGIATNVSRSHGHGNRRYRAAASAAVQAGVVEVADHAEETAGRVDDRRRIAATLTALGSLRRPEREVLVLCLADRELPARGPHPRALQGRRQDPGGRRGGRDGPPRRRRRAARRAERTAHGVDLRQEDVRVPR